MLTLSLSSGDELWHMILYQWLIDNALTERLLEVNAPRIVLLSRLPVHLFVRFFVLSFAVLFFRSFPRLIVRSLVCGFFVCSFFRSFIRSFVCSFVRSPVWSFIPRVVVFFFCSFFRSFIRSLVHSFDRPFLGFLSFFVRSFVRWFDLPSPGRPFASLFHVLRRSSHHTWRLFSRCRLRTRWENNRFSQEKCLERNLKGRGLEKNGFWCCLFKFILTCIFFFFSHQTTLICWTSCGGITRRRETTLRRPGFCPNWPRERGAYSTRSPGSFLLETAELWWNFSSASQCGCEFGVAPGVAPVANGPSFSCRKTTVNSFFTTIFRSKQVSLNCVACLRQYSGLVLPRRINLSESEKLLSCGDIYLPFGSADVDLESRLEYLSRAIMSGKSSNLRTSSSAEGEFLHELEEKLEVKTCKYSTLYCSKYGKHVMVIGRSGVWGSEAGAGVRLLSGRGHHFEKLPQSPFCS